MAIKLFEQENIKENQKKFLEFIKDYNELCNLFKTFSKYANEMDKELKKDIPFSNEYLLEKIKDLQKKIISKLTDLETEISELETILEGLKLSDERKENVEIIKSNIDKINNYMMSVKSEINRIEISSDQSNIDTVINYIKTFYNDIDREIKAEDKDMSPGKTNPTEHPSNKYRILKNTIDKYIVNDDSPPYEKLANNILNIIASNFKKYNHTYNTLINTYASVKGFEKIFRHIQTDLTNKFYKHLLTPKKEETPAKSEVKKPEIKKEEPKKAEELKKVEEPKKEELKKKEPNKKFILKKKKEEPKIEEPKKVGPQPGQMGQNEKGEYVISYTKKPVYYDFMINDTKSGDYIYYKGNKEVFRIKSND